MVGKTLHLHRMPCSEKQVKFLACPTLLPTSWALRNPTLSIRIGWPIMLCGRRRRCTSTGSPAQKHRPSFWPPLFSPPQLGSTEPLSSITMGWPIMLCGRCRRCTSTESPALNNRPSFWPALPFPSQLGPKEPPIVDRNRVAHHALRSASRLHLQREPCSEQQFKFLGCPTLPAAIAP